MEPDINLGFQLLIIGMVSVFLILGIVVGLGRTLIYLVSKFASVPVQTSSIKSSSISKERIAVMSSIVEVVTEGKGVLKSVTKV